MYSRILKGFFIVFLCCFFVFSSYAQNLPLDSKALSGQFENGLSYIVKPNANPENEIELRLVINAGSLYEEDSEQGFAHFVEHMCFNGTKNFPGNSLIDYLESKGLRFGKHFNALTSFAETKFMLSLPDTDEELLENAMQILEDWAHQVSFEDVEIDKERGVIIQELRTGLGAEERLRQQYFPAIFRGARYEYRLPIGKKNLLESFECSELRAFYHKWYRPERMAIIVSGDVDGEEILTKLENHFGHFKSEYPENKVPSFEVKDNEKAVFKVCSDPEASKDLIRIMYLDETGKLASWADLKTSLSTNLIIGMINKRHQKLNQLTSSPFIYSQVSEGYMVRTKDAFTITGQVKPEQIEKAVRELFMENKRLAVHGFTKEELEVEKKILIKQIKTRSAKKLKSKDIANELMAVYLNDEPIVDKKVVNEKSDSIINNFSLSELNDLAFSWLSKAPIVITSLNSKDSSLNFDQSKLAVIYNEVEQCNPEAYVSDKKTMGLEVSIDKPGKIIEENYNQDYNITEWILSNGSRVILKPTNFENDKVLFTSISKGGKSQYGDEDFVSASFSARLAYMSGLKGMSFSEMKDLMQIEGIKLGTWLNEYGEGTRGSTDSSGIEALLKLNYLYFNELSIDSSAAVSFMSRYAGQMKTMMNKPDYAFADTINNILYGKDSRKNILADFETLKEFNLSRANQIIEERYSDPSGFTFIIVGNFDKALIKPLVEKYIGGLKGEEKQESLPKNEYFSVKKSQEISIYFGQAKKSMVDVTFFGNKGLSEKEKPVAIVMREVLKTKLREVLREDIGGVYGISVDLGISAEPDDYFKFEVFFQCSPEFVDTLINAMNDQINLLIENGPDAEAFKKVKTVLSSEYGQTIKTNRYWQNELADIYGFDRDINKEIDEYLPGIMAVEMDQVRKLARKKLTDKNRLVAKMYPVNPTE